MMNTLTKTWLASCLALIVLLAIAGCSQKESKGPAEEPSTAAQPAGVPIDKSTVGSVSGTVKFDGEKPKAAKIDMSQDPACKGSNTSENVVADGGKLANVFVYVKDGLGDRSFAAPAEAVTIDQQGCRYHPHVLGVMVGQPLKVVNSDQTTHNIHPTPK